MCVGGGWNHKERGDERYKTGFFRYTNLTHVESIRIRFKRGTSRWTVQLDFEVWRRVWDEIGKRRKEDS